MYKSAFCGQIDEIPGISVDNFEHPKERKVLAYFLSHCHTDHTQGLYSEALIEALEETGASLYMSDSSAAIVDHETPDPRLMKYVQILKMGHNTITLPNPNDNDPVVFTVVQIPAGHSFGAVMFLFKKNKRSILYTGDFRMHPNDLPKYGHFHKDALGLEPIQIDVMYVDTTFISRRYQNFPKRSESIEALFSVIARHDGRVALHVSARYGYEFVYNQIYEKMGLKVFVGEDRWRFYSKVQHKVPGATNDETSKIHLCRNQSEKKDHTKCLPTTQTDSNFLYIHFSAMKWDNFDIEDKTFNRVSEKRVDVCFATHCSRSELKHFVDYFNPKKVVGFPEPYPIEDLNVKVEFFSIAPKKRKISSEKEIKLDKKIDKELLKEIFDI
ncbi:DNA repair metallo-beta-lactamase domain-containing protein [Phthorimaea operculella]|nr:DNA repair metallo-beta-lactamase domain-containing protein [Phthorimaea operculella]